MTTKVKTFIAMLALPAFLIACKKDAVEPPVNKTTAVKLVFTDNKVSPKLPGEGSTVDLSKATAVKIAYQVQEGNISLPVIKEAELPLAGDRSKVATIDQRVLSFKGGSILKITAVTLLDASGKAIATAPVPDEFKVSSPQGTLVMERSYEVTGLER